MNDLLRQIRNERRANLWLGVELLVVFAVMWYLVDWTYVTVRTWLQPMGFDTEHCYELTFNRLTPQAEGYQPGDDAEADMRNLLEIVERLRHRPGVEYVAVSQNSIPYIDGSNGFNLTIDSVRVSSMLRWGQPDYFRMFRIQGVAVLAEDGRKVFTTSSDSLAEAVHRSDRNVIISRNFVSAERYAKLGYADALPLLGYEGGERADGTYSFKVVGICEPMRWSHFSTTYQWGGPVGAYELLDSDIINLGNPLYVQVSLRLKPEADTGADFVEALMDDADRLYTLGNVFLLDVQPFTALQRTLEMDDVNEARTQFCVIGFLMLNIFLGVIGTFWFRTQHRRSEIALRMAFGSTRRGVFRRLMDEGLLLLTLAAVPAALIAFNVGLAELVDVERMPFNAVRFLWGIAMTWGLMALMIVLGIWYPARQAMRVQPAEALYDE